MTRETCKKLFSFYPCMIAVLVVLLCLSIWPLGLLGHTSYESASLERGIFPNLNLSNGSVLTGEFTPSRRHLTGISFRFLISGQAREGTVDLTLSDDTGTDICAVTLESGDVMNYRWVHFPLETELDPERTYHWHMQAHEYDEASLALYSGSPVIGPQEAGTFYYNGSQEEKLTPAMIYTYIDAVDETCYLPYYTVCLLFGLLLFFMCRKFEKTNEDA